LQPAHKAFLQREPGVAQSRRRHPATAPFKLQTLSAKRNPILDIVRALGMIFVMLIHSPGGDDKSNPATFLLKDFLAPGAIPVFFILSGYLGARKIDYSPITLAQYFKEKLRTLVAPFFFWNSVVLLLALVVRYLGFDAGLRRSGSYFSFDLTAPSIVSALIGVGRYPIVYQFWFLRNLIIIVFLAFFLRRYLPRIPLLPWFFFLIPSPATIFVGPPLLPIASCLAYYLIGHELEPMLPASRFPSVRSSILYCLCWFFMGIGAVQNWIAIPELFLRFGSAAFIFMFAIAISATPPARRLASLGPFVFFLYATHEPQQTFIGRIWQTRHWPGFDTLYCFLAIPTIAFTTCLFAYHYLCRFYPRFTAFATGGRSEKIEVEA